MTKEAEQAPAAMVTNKRAAQRLATMKEVRRLIGELDPEAALRMDKAARGRVPNAKRADDALAFLAEAVASLAAIAVEQSKPRKRGRPPKIAQ